MPIEAILHSPVDWSKGKTESEIATEAENIAQALFVAIRNTTGVTAAEADIALARIDEVELEFLNPAIVGSTNPNLLKIVATFDKLKDVYKAKFLAIKASAASGAPASPAVPSGMTRVATGTPISDIPTPAEIDAIFSNADERTLMKSVFHPVIPLDKALLSVLKEVKSELDGLSLRVTTPDARTVVANARKRIDEAYAYADQTRAPASMTWEQLLDEMEVKNVNPDAHQEYEQPTADRRLVALYQDFNRRKAPKPGETNREYLERLEYIVGWKLARAESQNQNENQMPSCTRAELFPVMGARGIERHELLTISTYHPEHGVQVQRSLRHLISLITSKKHPVMNYDSLIMENGRQKMKKYVDEIIKPQLLGLPINEAVVFKGFTPEQIASVKADPFFKLDPIYRTLSSKERQAKVDAVCDLILRIFYFFDLLTIALAELQKQTQTRSHDQLKSGQEITDKDRVLISRPDAAMVHRTQRYSADADWSAWWLVIMTDVPNDYGRGGLSEKREELLDRQHELQASLNAYFDITPVIGPKGIPPSSLFDPLFPDMMSYLTLAPGERLAIGNEVWEQGPTKPIIVGHVGDKIKIGGKDITLTQFVANRENYLTAEKGWEEMLRLTLGGLPSSITEAQILEHAPDFPTGMIDQIISKAAGLAKLFPGNHLKKGLAPLFTLYIARIFMRYQNTGKARETTFFNVVEKLRKAAGDQAGLFSYEQQIKDVINRISDNTDGKKLGRMLTLNYLNRVEERKAYVDLIWKERKWVKPSVYTPLTAARLSLSTYLDPQAQAQAREYVEIIHGNKPLPAPPVNRQGNLIRVKDEK